MKSGDKTECGCMCVCLRVNMHKLHQNTDFAATVHLMEEFSNSYHMGIFFR